MLTCRSTQELRKRILSSPSFTRDSQAAQSFWLRAILLIGDHHPLRVGGPLAMEAGPHRAAVVGGRRRQSGPPHQPQPSRRAPRSQPRAWQSAQAPREAFRRTACRRTGPPPPRRARRRCGHGSTGLEGCHDIGDGQNLLHCIASAFCTAARGPVRGDCSDTIAQFQIIEHGV